MKLLRILILVMIVPLSGCLQSFIPIQLSARDSKIDQWVSDKQFGRAIRAMEHKTKKQPSKRNKIKLLEIKTAAARFEKRIIARVNKKTRNGKWSSAFVILDDSLRSFPESKKLNHYRLSLSSTQTKTIKHARLKLVAIQAQYLLQTKPIYAKLAKVDPADTDIAWKLKKTILEIKETSHSLFVSGTQAIKQKNLELAQSYLELADQLNPTQNTTKALADLAQLRITRLQMRHQRLAKMRAAKIRTPLNNQQKLKHKKLMSLARTIRGALRRAEYDRASKILSKVSLIAPDHPEIARLRLDVDRSIHSKVRTLVHRGNDLYSKGHIKQARSSWTQALKLSPQNKQVQSSVARANRVLSKLREIKSSKIQ